MNTQNSTPILKGLPPFIPTSPQILLLGSMPSAASLQEGFYYAFRYNRFWPIIAVVSGHRTDSLTEKKAALEVLGLALHDVIGSCRRHGSLDTSIRDIELNNLNGLLQAYPSIQRIITNGTLASRLFNRYHAELKADFEVIHLPSTSPANAKMTLEKLTELYAQALKM